MQNPGHGKCVAGIVLGIVSIVGFWVPYLNTIALICGIAGIVLSSQGRKISLAVGAPTDIGTAGLVLSIIGTIIAGIGFLTCTVCTLCLGGLASSGEFEDMINDLYYYMD